MKNENKCFFSISLENGFTITGENPYKVMDFLISLECALYWAAEHYADHYLEELHDNTEILLNSVSNAALTIKDHIDKEEREEK